MNKKEKIIKEVEKFFAKHNISGIIRIPNAGTTGYMEYNDGKKVIIETFAQINRGSGRAAIGFRNGTPLAYNSTATARVEFCIETNGNLKFHDQNKIFS